MNRKEIKLIHGYGFIRKYLDSRIHTLTRVCELNREGDSHEEVVENEIQYVKELLNDLEYLETCAQVIDDLRDAKPAFKTILEKL
jgi:hypothetical protein